MQAKFSAACAKGAVETVSAERAPPSAVNDASRDCTPAAQVMLHTDEVHAMGIRGIRSDAYIQYSRHSFRRVHSTPNDTALRLQAPAGVWDSALKSVLSQVHPDYGLQPEAMALLGEATTKVLARLLSRSITDAPTASEAFEVSIEQPSVALGLPPAVELAAPTPPPPTQLPPPSLTPPTMASQAPFLMSDLRCEVNEEAPEAALALAIILEYLMAEVLELAGNVLSDFSDPDESGSDDEKPEGEEQEGVSNDDEEFTEWITVDHIRRAVADDEELSALLSDILDL
eukprot:jgi/Chrpa1/24512/Chrysochromulina_OHIO_Genome00026380-RA